LDDIDAEGVRRSSVAPGHRVMPSRTSTPLKGGAQDGVSDVANVQNGTKGLRLGRSQPFVVYARGTICMHVAFGGVNVMNSVREHHHATLRKHDVVVELLR